MLPTGVVDDEKALKTGNVEFPHRLIFTNVSPDFVCDLDIYALVCFLTVFTTFGDHAIILSALLQVLMRRRRRRDGLEGSSRSLIHAKMTMVSELGSLDQFSKPFIN